MLDLSIIIPVYDGEHTIVRCLDSIYKLNISEEEFEVIVIDDCSKDNTLGILLDYSIYHVNLKVLHQIENHRQGAARNRGVRIAKGDYIAFVDGDDIVSDGLVHAYKLAKEKSLDIVAMAYQREQSDGTFKICKEVATGEDNIFSGRSFIENYPYWCSAPWGYLFNRSFLEKVQYPFAEDVIYEDSDFVIAHLIFAKRMSFSSLCGYFFLYNTGSTTKSWSYKNSSDYYLLGTRMLSIFEQMDDSCKEEEFARIILEGGSFNIWNTFKHLYKKASWGDLCAFYERIDKHSVRNKYTSYTAPTYCWTFWTKLCLRNKHLAVFIISLKHCFFALGKNLFGQYV